MTEIPRQYALEAATPEMVDAAGHELIRLTHFPFRIGRESRRSHSTMPWEEPERRQPDSRPNNDLYLVDHGSRKMISREHLQFELTEEGALVCRDRGSTCGTHVMRASGVVEQQTEWYTLYPGDTVIIGRRYSHYAFKIQKVAVDLSLTTETLERC